MSKYESPDFIKEAAQHLRGTLKRTYGADVGSAHAHDAIAGALGFGSKIALLESEEISPDDPCLSRHNDLNIGKTAEVISRMRETPLKDLPIDRVVRIIKDGLTPGCACCGNKTALSVIVGDCGDDKAPDEPEWICPACARDEDEFGNCWCCGNSVLYRLKDLNSNGECDEHTGESDLDPEEIEDRDSYIEYLQKE